MVTAVEARNAADNVLPGHGSVMSVADRLRLTAESLEGTEMPDMYGAGEFIQAFEREVAGLFGKSAGVFMPSGTMAQQIALRIWCERDRNFAVAMHPTSHLEFAEHGGMQFLHNIRRLQFGSPEFIAERMLTVDDLDSLAVKPASLLLELPYRPLGGSLPTWDEVVAMSAWCRDRNIPIHLDGARIWQCASVYSRSYAEIGALFDSIYVSFYKDLGGIAGCLLMGDDSFIAESKVWQRRHGGNLPDQSVLVAAAKQGMERTLPVIDDWVARAKKIAALFSAVDGVIVNPEVPHVNFFQLFLKGEAEVLAEKHHQLSIEEGTFLFGGLRSAPMPGYATCEVHVFENGMQFDAQRGCDFLARLVS